jgi:nitrite reductase (NADH) small subunit
MTTGESNTSSDYLWVRVTTTDNIPVREGRPVRIGSHEIAIFNLGDRFLATDNRCPHQGGPLCDGIVTGESVVCPLHAWKVNLANGSIERPTAGKDHCVRTYPVRVDQHVLVVGVPAAASSEGAAA